MGGIAMTFTITRTSYFWDNINDRPCDKAYWSEANECWKIDINSIEELMDLIRDVESDIVVKDDPEIEIYDEYRE